VSALWLQAMPGIVPSQEATCQSATLDALAPTHKMARISNAPKPASTLIKQTSRTQIADNKIALEPQRALVARMW
jgi:hypothetical protein